MIARSTLLLFLLLMVVRCAVPSTVTTPPASGAIGVTSPPRPETREALPQTQSLAFDLPQLRQQMLQLVNKDRLSAGLMVVGWDELAAEVAQKHAEEQAANKYVSHWNLSGHGPDHQYSMAGGRYRVMENVHARSYRSISGLPPLDWSEVVETAERGLMNSPGHRRTILDPDLTHVGIGIASDPSGGEVRVVQLFVARFVSIESYPQQAQRNQDYLVTGRLLPGTSDPLVNLAREPFPQPMTIEQLNATSTYQSAAEIYRALPVHLDSSGVFRVPVRFEGSEGLHHIRLWVKFQDRSVLASDLVVEVR